MIYALDPAKDVPKVTCTEDDNHLFSESPLKAGPGHLARLVASMEPPTSSYTFMQILGSYQIFLLVTEHREQIQ